MCKPVGNDVNAESSEKFCYRNFLYLNYDILKSFSAQKNKGLPQSFSTETMNEKSEDKTGEQTTTEPTIEGKIDTILKLLKPSLLGKVSAKYIGDRTDESFIESKKSVMSKVLRDDMYNEFSEYIKKSETFCTYENATVEKYIELNDEFYYIDFERLKNLYNSEYFKNLKEFDDVKKKINSLSELIPFDALLCTKKFIILIDKEWLQYKKEHIGYAFEGKINVLGRIGKCIEVNNKNDKPNLITMLNESQKYALSLLKELCGFLTDENVYLITPVAIYY